MILCLIQSHVIVHKFVRWNVSLNHFLSWMLLDWVLIHPKKKCELIKVLFTREGDWLGVI